MVIGSASSAEDNDAATEPSVGQLSYVGGPTQVSVGYDSEFDLYGELFQVLSEESDTAWLGRAWFASDAGGLQLSYHWLDGEGADDAADALKVQKVFLAIDQNQEQDRKVTAGWGMEKPAYFVETYLSAAVTGERRAGQTLSSVTDTITTEEDGIIYSQDLITTTITDLFEHPYDYGVGFRVGRFYDEHDVRVRGGLDYEWGEEDASQVTLTLGGEKFFRNSPHSVGVQADAFRKSGSYEQDDDDVRAAVFYRYSFGKPYRSEKVAQTPPAAVAPAFQNDISLDSNAFFDFDRSELRPETRRILSELAGKLKAAEIIGPIKIIGHTCSIGTEKYNQGLSERRAESVRRFFVENGLPAAQMTTEGRGELDPRYPNDTEASRQKNRRVDISVVTAREAVAMAPTAAVEWKTEPVWIERALHNPVEHKRRVDYYRVQKTSTEVTYGERVPVNAIPVAVNDTATAPRNSPGIVVDVLSNDSDPDGDPLTVTSVTQPGSGTATNNGGNVTYVPAADFTGVDVFTYTISDGRGGAATATVTVTVVEQLNQPPVAVDDHAVTNRNLPVTIGVLNNDSDPDGDTLVVSAVTDPEHGTVTNNGTDVTYAPDPDFAGTDTFVYTASDGKGGTDTATVTINVQIY